MKSKTKWRSRLYRVTRFVIVSFIFLMTTSLVVITYLNYQDFDDKPNNSNYVGTTTRRVISTSKRTSRTTSYVEEITTTTKRVETTTTNNNVVDKTTKKTTTKKTTTAKGITTTTKKTTTKKTTTTKRIIRETTDESTTFPNAIDFWAWNIFDMINAERMSIGLDPLEVAIDLRDQAEEAADYWYDHTDAEVDQFLGKTTYYGRQLVNSSYIEGYKYLYDVTISHTDIARNKNYRYVGIATLFRERSIYGMATHYYIIIYE